MLSFNAVRSRLLRHFDPRLAAEMRTQRRPIMLGLLCTAVCGALNALTVVVAKSAMDTIQELGGKLTDDMKPGFMGLHKMPGVYALAAAIFLLYAVRYWFTRGQNYYLSEAANRLAADLRMRMMRKLLRLPIGYYNDRRAGAIQSVLTNDVSVYQFAIGIIRDSIQGPITAVGAFALMVYYSWQLSLIGLVLIPVMVWVIQRNSRKMRSAQTAIQQDLADVNASMVEVLSGTRVIKAFGAEERVGADYDRLVENTFSSQMRAIGIYSMLRPLQDVLGATALVAFFCLSGVLAARGILNVSHIVALGVAMDQVNQGFKSLGGVSNTFATVQAASSRIYSEVLDIPESREFASGRCLPSPEGRVRFENVSFEYPDGTKALDQVSFEIEPGTSLALVGPSGAGKSTIADLILRFYDPTEGRILFDGIDLGQLDVRWYRSQIGVVPQHTFLFAGTIEENVRMGEPDASEEEIREALRQAHATEFADEMGQRATTELGERGVRLSGGQMQRVAIARALVRRPSLLLLDEATAALDATSEKLVTEALDEVMKSRTTLFIAHRLTTAARADRILVLSRGQVVETGSHRALLEANGTYAGLFRAFSGGVLE